MLATSAAEPLHMRMGARKENLTEKLRSSLIWYAQCSPENVSAILFVTCQYHIRPCVRIYLASRRAFAQGVSDHQLGTFASTIDLALSVSTFALVFNSRHVSAIHSVFFCNDSAMQSVFYTNFEPTSFVSTRISNSASSAATTTVSCLNSAQCAREAASPGASCHWNSSPFESGGASFFEAFSRAFVSTQMPLFNQN